MTEGEAGIHVGATVSIQQLIDFVTEVIGRRPAEQTTGLQALKRHTILMLAIRCAARAASPAISS